MSEPRAAPSTSPWIGPDGRRTERLELHLAYECPNRCCFCSEAERMAAFRDHPPSWGQVATVLRRHAARGVRQLHLTGGEPTTHPCARAALGLARKLGMRTSLSTNGSGLCRRELAEGIVPLLDDVMLSLHGPTAEVHEALTRRRGSFADLLAAVARIHELAPALELHVNIVLIRANAAVVADTVRLAGELGASLIVVSNVSPEGRALGRYAELAVPLEQLAELVPPLPALAPEAILRFFGMPLCILGGHAMLSNDLHWDPRVTVEWAAGPGKAVLGEVYSWQPDRNRCFVAECEGCARRGVCRGVFARYGELRPTSRLDPRGGPGP